MGNIAVKKIVGLVCVVFILISCFEDVPVGDSKTIDSEKEHFELSYNFSCFDTLSNIEHDVNEASRKKDQQALLQQKRDSLLKVWNKLMSLKIELPSEIDTTIFSKACIRQFNELANQTGGEVKVVANARLVTKTITDIIKSEADHQADVMLVIDKTSSMSDDIENIRQGVKQIFKALKKYDEVRLSVATYGDRRTDGSSWYSYQNFNSDFAGAFNFINRIALTGGGDFPESVYDGVYQAFQEGFWRSESKRIVILLGDAPSLEGSGTNYSSDDIIALATANKVHMNFYPILLSPYATATSVPKTIEKKAIIESVFPNPSYGPLNIQLSRTAEYTIDLFNQSGGLVFTTKMTADFVELDLNRFSNGLYMLRVTDEKKNYDTQKIILSK